MPRKHSKSPATESDIKQPSLRSRWLWATLCLLFGLLTAIAFVDYDASQHPDNSTLPAAPNAIGKVGSATSVFCFDAFGGACWAVPVFLFWIAYLFIAKSRRSRWLLFAAVALAVVSLAGLLDIQNAFFTERSLYRLGPGGAIGHLVYGKFMEIYLGNVGSTLILATVLLVCLAFVFVPASATDATTWGSRFAAWREGRTERRAELKEAKRLARLAAQEEKEKERVGREEAKRLARQEKERAKELAREGRAASKRQRNGAAERDNGASQPVAAANGSRTPRPEPEPAKPKLSEKIKIVAAEETKKARVKLPEMAGDYTFPKLDLLAEPAKPHFTNSEEEHGRNAERLVQTLKEFNVEVSLGEIHIGPVITRYEVYPAPGVRVEKISNLDKNIALGMRAQSVRILAPVPGKGCVGIEVPNENPTPVGIREILESEDWAKSKAEIPIALGRDVSGKPIISDLTRMPHLLIAGATGSGKTVCINSIITSLLYHSSPENLRFIMVDPKIVEMKVFNALPHMLIPVVTDPKKVPGALKWLLNEMEHRYQLFAKVGVRNIAGFNGRKKPEKQKTPAEKAEDQGELEISVPRDPGVLDEIPEKIPYIVCIVDELADLMMVAPADIETGIARLAQLARAAGIHLVLATQRPSVNVITGVIKANLPCRIAFQVASKIDSRTILDGSGAEQLIGRGDMLFSPPGTSTLIRSQGAFVADEEIAGIVDFLKTNGPPKFAEEVQKQIEAADDMGGGDGLGEDGNDELFPQALDVLRATKRASTSMLQRRLKIGYNRAARLMEELEDRGIVGPENGSSPREILVDLDSM